MSRPPHAHSVISMVVDTMASAPPSLMCTCIRLLSSPCSSQARFLETQAEQLHTIAHHLTITITIPTHVDSISVKTRRRNLFLNSQYDVHLMLSNSNQSLHLSIVSMTLTIATRRRPHGFPTMVKNLKSPPSNASQHSDKASRHTLTNDTDEAGWHTYCLLMRTSLLHMQLVQLIYKYPLLGLKHDK